MSSNQGQYANNTTGTGATGTHHHSGGLVDQAKQFLTSSHMADSTEVCTETAPLVVQEYIRPSERIETVEAIDRERHIHHHQHRVQPIQHQEILPTREVTNVLPEQVRESKHDMLAEHREKLESQRTMHQNTTTTAPVVREQVTAGAQANEHVHHHVHETIQPVLQKETIQQTVVHTVVPIHERIHDAPIVHEATTLPTLTLQEFEAKIGGPHSHKDSTHHHQFYDGAPRVGGGAAGAVGAAAAAAENHHHHNSTTRQ